MGVRLAAVIAGALALSQGSAHEIKVFASQQAPEEPGKITVYLAWGHRVPVDDLIDATAITRYEWLAPDGAKNPLKAEGVSLQAHAIELKSPGVHQAVVDRKPSEFTYVIDPNGERQLKRGGRSTITQGTIDSAGRSFQCGKAMIVVGAAGGELPKPAGQAVEIVPLAPPSKWKANADLPFQVLVQGKPFAGDGTVVEARPVGFKPDNAWSFATGLNKKGEAVVRPDKAGTWVVKVKVSRKTTGETAKEFDTETFTATLTLEVAP